MAYDLTLYHAHTACSRVTLTALEQCGHPYRDHLLTMQKGEHKQPEFLAVNPDGKVPVLLVDGRPLAENGAILMWLADTFPDASLFPPAASEWEKARQLSDLFWVSSGWHPYVRANKVPFMWTTGDVEPVRERGRELLGGVVQQLDDHLADRPWWYGDRWSIIDTYLWWAYTNAEIGGFSIAAFPQVQAHRQRNESLPQLQRALAREAAAVAARESSEA
jgi:glutathione S-transferase